MADEKLTERAREVVADAAAELRDIADDGVERARERFEEAAETFEGGVRRTRREMRRRAEELGEATREKYDRAVEGVQRGYEKVRKDAADLADDVNTYVRENPGKSVLMAAGAGFVLGLLMRGRRRDEI
jgi:ElaB/YqjD/DUF883 family membrane-anchored ribosome-binding protein